jgi:hypothetical protein
VEVRYNVTLEGKVVGTVSLPERTEALVVARLNPLPAFRAVRAVRGQLRAVDRASVSGREPTDAEMAGEEEALYALAQLELYLVNERTGVPVPNASVRLLRGEPPRVRVQFWQPEDALDHPDAAG